MNNLPIIRFEVQQGWGDYKIVWLMRFDGVKSYNGYLKNGDIEWQEVKEGTDYTKDITPFMRLPRQLDLQSFVDALVNKVPPKKQDSIDAELKATKYHLEDMRKLALKL